MKYIRGIVAFSLVCMTLLAAPGFLSAADEGVSKGVVARVNGVDIKRFTFDAVLNGRVLPMSSFHGNISDEVRNKKMEEALDIAIEEELYYNEAVRQGIDVGKAEAAKEVEAIIEKAGGQDKFNEALDSYGITMAEYDKFLRITLMVDALKKKEIEDKAVVTEGEIKKYYEENKSTHFKIERKRFRHILFYADPSDPSSWERAKNRAEMAFEAIKNGEDFVDVVYEYSDGPKRDEGGDTGLLGRSQLHSALADAAWDLKVGETTGIVQTLYGYHIMQLIEIPPVTALPFDEVKGEIERTLLLIRKGRLEEALKKRLTENAVIERFDIAK